MFQPSEMVTLVFALAALAVMGGVGRGVQLPARACFFAGFAAMTAAYVFTVVEGIVWHDLFDGLEHLSYLLAALALWRGIAALHRGEDCALGRRR